MSDDVILRAGTPDDAERLGNIVYDAFFKISSDHNFPPDFPNPEIAIGLTEMMLARPDVYSVVAENGKVLGSNFLWEADEVDGVGPITVDPAVQNGSIGKRLMQDVIARSKASGKRSVRLVQAAFHNRSLALYTKLGFDTVEPLSGVNGPAFTVKIAGHNVRPMTDDDIETADSVCRRVHAVSRKNEIAGSVEIGSGLVVENAGRIAGYATSIGMFGHAAAETNDALKALIGSGQEIQGPGFLLPTRNNEVLRWCLANGLRIVQPLTLMSMGFYQEPRGAFIPSILY
jgi:GNAT superfamily N-acetyltransferase